MTYFHGKSISVSYVYHQETLTAHYDFSHGANDGWKRFLYRNFSKLQNTSKTILNILHMFEVMRTQIWSYYFMLLRNCKFLKTMNELDY